MICQECWVTAVVFSPAFCKDISGHCPRAERLVLHRAIIGFGVWATIDLVWLGALRLSSYSQHRGHASNPETPAFCAAISTSRDCGLGLGVRLGYRV